MLYLIGLNHRAQARIPRRELTEEQRVFSDSLLQTINRVRPAFIAEEDSEEALAIRKKVGIAKEIADARGIEHRFCDPTEAERRVIGYRDGQSLELELFMNNEAGLTDDEIFCKAHAVEIGKYFPIRESFWLSRVRDCLKADGIFICGDLHIETFGKMLAKEGVAYEVVLRGIGAREEDSPYEGAVAYLAAHPELAITEEL